MKEIVCHAREVTRALIRAQAVFSEEMTFQLMDQLSEELWEKCLRQ